MGADQNKYPSVFNTQDDNKESQSSWGTYNSNNKIKDLNTQYGIDVSKYLRNSVNNSGAGSGGGGNSTSSLFNTIGGTSGVGSILQGLGSIGSAFGAYRAAKKQNKLLREQWNYEKARMEKQDRKTEKLHNVLSNVFSKRS